MTAATASHDLGRLPVLVRLARRTLATIRAKLFWAFAYNTAALPLAAGIFEPSLGWRIPSQWAAAAMAASSLVPALLTERWHQD